ncbi:MAG: DNA/RNA non-specific endonuclease, partial [Sphingomonadales bacterium]|nr:DNA/RNA non-specific endonuclease [Sphingomonadales bacterium]
MIQHRRTLIQALFGSLFLVFLVEGGYAQSKKERSIVLEDFHPVFVGSSSKVVMLKYSAYDAGYSVEDVQPAWVGYRLNRNRVGGFAERANKFQREPRLEGRDANDRDYSGSGFDKGHLVPAADMAWSVQSMMESFSYANVSPQRPGFNRGIWKRLESQVRDWAATLTVDDTVGLLVWSGPVLSENSTLSTVGRLRVSEAFYKVVYHPAEERVATLLLPHSSSKASLVGYLVSVDSLEKVTGMDFLRGLPDQREARL